MRRKEEKMEFLCGGKCRICPYPGAQCKHITVKPDIPEREVDEKPNWMDPEFQDELRKMKHLG